MAILLQRNPSLLHFSFIFLLLFSFFFPCILSTIPPIKPSTEETITISCQILRTHGYSIFASFLETSAGKLNWNFTGTLFAPSDLAFTGKFIPSTTLFLYHVIQESLRSEELQFRSFGTGFPTFSNRRCLFLCRNLAGELCVSTSNKIPATRFARIRRTNLYVDDNLSVHGIDGILNPAEASPCNPTVNVLSPSLPPSPSPSLLPSPFLDHVIRAMKRNGYTVLAMMISMHRNELTALSAVTVFFPSDSLLLGGGEGFRYNFRYHVIPLRLPFIDLARLPSGTRIDALITGKSIVVNSGDGAVRLNGISITQPEIYLNSWMIVHAISRPFQVSDSHSGSVVSGVSAYVPVGPTSVANLPDSGTENLPFSIDVTGEIPSISPSAGAGISDPNSTEIESSVPRKSSKKKPGNQDSVIGQSPSGRGHENYDGGLRNSTAVDDAVTVLLPGISDYADVAPSTAPVSNIPAEGTYDWEA